MLRVSHLPILAGCSAFQVFLSFDILFFSAEKIICKKLLLYIFKSQSCHCICKTLSCDTLLTEQKNCLFHYRKNLFLICKYFVQITALSNSFAHLPPMYTRNPLV